MFSEGKVNQQNTFETLHGVTSLPRFKWGVCVRWFQLCFVSPSLIEPQLKRSNANGDRCAPRCHPNVADWYVFVVCCFPLMLRDACKQGFDKLMPENRPLPWKYIPRLGCKLSITFGDPLSAQDIQVALRVLSHKDHGRHTGRSRNRSLNSSGKDIGEGDGEERLFGIDHAERVREGTTRESIGMDMEESRKRKIDHVRSMVTAVVQRGVEAVGRRVSGDTLGKKANT